MGVSDYNIYVPLRGDEYLLVHGYTGAADCVKTNVIRFLWDFARGIYNPKLVSKKTLQLLKNRGYLTDRSLKEERIKVIEIAQLLSKIEKKYHILKFVIIPTYSCNLKCTYCYENILVRKKLVINKQLANYK
jgi:uncharacterized protein